MQRAAGAIGRIVKDGRRASDIIDRIRAMAKKGPPQKHNFGVNEAISDVIGLAHSEMSKHGVRLQRQLAEALPEIRGDRVQLQQVILNLMMNAIEAMSQMSDGPRDLLISTHIEAGSVVVAVRDSGPGLSAAALDRVFDAFYTTKSTGLGIGLSICRSIVENHGGRLWAAANVPKGAAFQFTLPVHSDD